MVLLIGSWARAMSQGHVQLAYRLHPVAVRPRHALWQQLLHIGIIAILGGHFVGLLTPHALYEPFITSSQKQLLAMVVGGFFGALSLVGITILLVRRLTSRPRVRAINLR